MKLKKINKEKITKGIPELIKKIEKYGKKRIIIGSSAIVLTLVIAGASFYGISKKDEKGESQNNPSSVSTVISESEPSTSIITEENNHYLETGEIDFNSFTEFEVYQHDYNTPRREYKVVIKSLDPEIIRQKELIEDVSITKNLAYILGKNDNNEYELRLIDLGEYLESPESVREYIRGEDNYNPSSLTERHLIPYLYARSFTRMSSDEVISFDGKRSWIQDGVEVSNMYDMADEYLKNKLGIESKVVRASQVEQKQLVK